MRKLLISTAFAIACATQAMAEPFFAGGFQLDPEVDRIVLFNPPLAEDVTARVTCEGIVNDGELARFRADVGPVQVIAPFNDQGSVMLSGRKIAIRLHQDRQAMPCYWTAVDNDAQAIKSVWAYDIAKDSTLLLGTFPRLQQFRVEINTPEPGCQPGRATVFVDGKQITDYGGNPMKLNTGSSFIGKGKIVHVIMEGRCDPGGFYNGALSIPAP